MVRLGAEGVRRASGEPHVRQMELGGKPLAAFVLVAPAGIADDDALGAWIERGLAFVTS